MPHADRAKVLLVDGNSLVNRAFFALPPLSTADGQPTNAILGFLTMLLRLFDEEKPDHVAVAFDKSAPTFRHQAYDQYKAHRTGAPDDLRAQFDPLKEVLDALGVARVELEGYEADDLLGTLSSLAEKAGADVLVVTGDRDALQLISDRVKVVLTVRGISETKVYDFAALKEQYGLAPAQVADLKGLMGDASDNIPGVPGVGEKTALKLLQAYGSVEGVLAHADEVSGAKLRENLFTHADDARLSKRLATIDRNVPLPGELTSLDAMARRPADEAHLAELLRRLELKTVARKLAAGGTGAAETVTAAPAPERGDVGDGTELRGTEARAVAYGDTAVLKAMADKVKRQGSLVYFWEPATAPGRAARGSIGVSAGDGDLLEVDLDASGETPAAPPLPLPGAILELFESASVGKVGHDVKSGWTLLRRSGFMPRGLAFDTALAAYLLDPIRGNYTVASLAKEHLGVDLSPAGTGAEAGAGAAAGVAAEAVRRLAPILEEKLASAGLASLFRDVELPLVDVLASMEAVGVGVDLAALGKMGDEFALRLHELAEEIYSLAGLTFNINSTKQLADVLFGKLQLTPTKKTPKGAPSTDAEALEGLAEEHPVVAKILEHRTLTKLKSTYVDGLRNLADPATGRVHTTFNQMITATGRLSSTEPNLQNIPVRLPLGRRLRKVFVPSEPGRVLLAADYSQIELRILAHLSADPVLSEAFRRGEDIHRRTAAEIFGLPPEEVDETLRDRAKAVNFGIVYGISDFGLARNTGVPRREAARFIESYFDRYQGVKRFIEETVAIAREQGYVTTILNRRRRLPDINSRNRNLRMFAERTAVNTPIQGSAADIIKLAMVRLHREMAERRLASRMLLQVHDELIFEVPEAELPGMVALVREVMEGAYPLDVPLVVDMKAGPNWYDVKDLE